MKRKRLTIDLPIKVRKQLEKLKKETGALSLTGIVQRSINLFDFFWEVKKHKTKIILEEIDGKQTEVILVEC